MCQVDDNSRHSSVCLVKGMSPGLCERARGEEVLGVESVLDKNIGLLNGCGRRRCRHCFGRGSSTLSDTRVESTPVDSTECKREEREGSESSRPHLEGRVKEQKIEAG
jgi:hypothetical protein